LPYFLTLPVQYQRWLYQGYAYQWNNLTPAGKQAYASSGVRHHLTGFQYFMKYQLINLPDILGWWKLDGQSGALALDSSRNSLDATIFGASLTDGVIDRAYHFDGLNDYLNCGSSTILDPPDSFCFECWFKVPPVAAVKFMVRRYTGAGRNGYAIILNDVGQLLFYLPDSVGWKQARTLNRYDDDTWYHLICQWDTTIDIFIDGLEVAYHTHNTCLGRLPAAANTYIGCDELLTSHLPGDLDNIILGNRPLDTTEILRHSSRRYP